MIEPRPDRLPARPPTVSPPRPFVERRHTFRRAEDQVAHEEKVLLARALDVLASDIAPEERLAGLLRLLARTVGARRAAVIADGIERRAAVAVDPGEPSSDAERLATWLDAHAPRSRARRAAAGRAPISFIVGAAVADETAADETAADLVVVRGADGARTESPDRRPATGPHYAAIPIPSAGDVVLGFEFRRAADADRLADRLPPTLARHAAVALALVTEQLATERELAALRAGDAERTTFVSTVAHELRTPLTGLRGYLELILDGQVPDPEVARDFLERGRDIVGSMGELVGDLLELSRLESGTLGLELEPFSVAEAGNRVAAGLLPIALERGVDLTTSLPPRLRIALGDRRRVEQIITNLAGNALKFTPAGGTVEIVGRVEGLAATVTIRDDGAGIPAGDRALIFERFHRMAGHERIVGTGLGLPIARDLARQMDGDLDVASVSGVGSAFVLVLPGAAGAPSGAIAEALTRALDAEQGRLERRETPSSLEDGAADVSRAVEQPDPDDAAANRPGVAPSLAGPRRIAGPRPRPPGAREGAPTPA
ncbi:MAG: two-component system, OmpR family, phosphate regulon sensor histidine kinase PhoR [Chloroflexota bacterium]|nr:two-component system, OmpR family, phosphate regulon sensor histidine kinase PhoR [Chloroflexota bacterium]